ncbi:MAG: hypothetical protein AUG51_08230 [Acidobacteria bacterium 13_1_20CM_3_53_8]|nr:MAG: hypothetical protein AUG51_08230 [Acidobacteria bacterium 13_1_20CM_3_53_8]
MNRLKRTSACLVLALLLPAITLAQQISTSAQQQGGASGQSIRGAQLKGRVPVNRKTLKVKMPKLQEAALLNGLRIVLLENHEVPTFNMQMVILSGGMSDPSDMRGVALVTAALLREGTSRRTSREIAEQTEAIGSSFSINAGISSWTSFVFFSGLSEKFDQALDIFSDVILNPTFPQEEVQKYASRSFGQIQVQRSNPSFVAQEQFLRAVYGDHPAGTLVPPPSTLKNIKAADLQAFYAAHYRPNNAILFVTGDLNLRAMMPKLEQAFGSWQKGSVQAANFPAIKQPTKSRIYLIDRPNSVQTSLFLGGLGVERTSPDYYAGQVMNQIFGGGPAARLFLNLREDHGYTYGAYSSFGGNKYPGFIAAYTDVRTDVTEDAMRELMNEIKRIGEERVSTDELENAKRSLVGGFALSLDSPQALLSNVVIQKLYGFSDNYWDTYPQKIADVTSEDVQRVARKYLSPSTLQIIAVGDASKTQAALAKYGTVEVYDSEGKPVRAANGRPSN